MLVQGQVSRQDVAGPVGIAVNVVGKTYESYKGLRLAECPGEYVEYHPDAYGEPGDPESPAGSGVGRRATGIFLLWEAITHRPVPPEKEGMVHFIGLDVFHGADGVPVIQRSGKYFRIGVFG